MCYFRDNPVSLSARITWVPSPSFLWLYRPDACMILASHGYERPFKISALGSSVRNTRIYHSRVSQFWSFQLFLSMPCNTKSRTRSPCVPSKGLYTSIHIALCFYINRRLYRIALSPAFFWRHTIFIQEKWCLDAALCRRWAVLAFCWFVAVLRTSGCAIGL